MANEGVLLCIFISIATVSMGLEIVSVKTSIGMINGFVEENTFLGKSSKIHKYLGIPYAEAPVGELRFKKPVQKLPLEAPLDAFRHKSACSQINFGLFRGGEITYDEDCLHLNIYVPERQSDDKRLPVMVWIFGGGFTVGFSDIYIGDNLATHGDVIVVTLNYRLSVWGFLTTDDDSAPGNYGLWDQHLAIKWVHDNIAAFGGDASRVTIFGESAGSASVMHQALYPGNKGLFQRVIGQSGSIGAFWGTSRNNLDNAKKLGSLAGCKTDESETLVSCLRGVPTDKLEELVSNVTHGFVRVPFPFLPTFDGHFVTTPLQKSFNQNSSFPDEVKEFFSSLDVLTGVNSGEGSLGLSPLFGIENPEEFLPNRTYFEEKLVPVLVNICFGGEKTGVVSDTVIAEYTHWENPDDPINVRNAFTSMWGDVAFTGLLYKTLDTHARLSPEQRTYMYVFDEEPEFSSFLVPVSWFTKLGHAEDLPFVFGFTNLEGLDDYHITPSPWELHLSADVMALFSNFAKTGYVEIVLEGKCYIIFIHDSIG